MSDDYIEPPAAGSAPPASEAPAPAVNPFAKFAKPGANPFAKYAKPSTPPAEAPGMLSRAWSAIVGGGEQGGDKKEPPGMLGRAWDRLVGGGNLLGLEGPGALQRSSEIAAERPYRPGIKMGGMISPDWQANPMLGAIGPGNMARAGVPPTPAQNRLGDFAGQGVTPNVPAIGQTYATGLAARAGRALPFSPVSRGIQGNVDEVARAAEQRASGFGAAGADEGGQIAQNALKRFAADKSQSVADYGRFWGMMHGAPPAAVPQTLRTLNDIHGRFPSAPELEGLFTNPKLNTMRESLTPRQVNIPAQQSPILNQLGAPATVTPAQTVQRGGSLSIPELKELKTQVGYMLEKPPQEIPRAQLKQLYGAIGSDLRTAAAARSPQAARSLAVADANFAKRMTMMDQLSAMVDKDAPEGVFRAIEMAAGEGAGAHASLLRTAKEAIGQKDWGDVGASMIRRLGNPRPGMPRDPSVPEFSVDTFASNWRKLSPKAKEVLFGPDNPGTPRGSLEQLGRVAGAVQNVNRLVNPAGTWQQVGMSSIITELITSMLMGRAPVKELGGLAGSYGVAKMLMSPWFARLAYDTPEGARETISSGVRASIPPEAGKEYEGTARKQPPPDRDSRHSVGAH